MEDTPRPLNPTLYDRLAREFGSVIIANEGEAYIPSLRSMSIREGERNSPAVAYGEYYRVCCPFCGDGRHRLWVNHRFGVYDQLQQSKNLHLAICYNEDCVRDSARRHQFENMVYRGLNWSRRRTNMVRAGGEEVPISLTAVDPPGTLTRLGLLSPQHAAVLYLEERGYNIRELDQVYNITYCEMARPEYPTATNRIVAPAYMHGELVGWQCRYIGDANWNYTGIPKYYTRPKMPKRRVLYNYDVAAKHFPVVLVEGVTDVWSVGPQAVAVFGKRLHELQARLLAETWSTGSLVIMFDSDAEKEIGMAVERMRPAMAGGVVSVQLPPGKDPADFDRDTLWEIIHNTAREQGVQLHVGPNETDVSHVGRGLSSAAPSRRRRRAF